MLLVFVCDERLSTNERCYHIFPDGATVFYMCPNRNGQNLIYEKQTAPETVCFSVFYISFSQASSSDGCAPKETHFR